MLDSATDTVSGNNTYNTPAGYTPTAAGTYEWVASYSGDANNNSIPSPALNGPGSELEMVDPASPTLTTTPGGTIVLSSGNTLSDSATLKGGYGIPTGTITFTLYASNGTTVVDTETDSVSGNGTYGTPSGYTPTVAGTYYWVASYSGDDNNNSVSATTQGNEPETVSAAVTLMTTPGGTIVLGSGNTLSDSPTLTGGYNPTGTITFTLDAPDGSVVDTGMDTVHGDNTYATPSGYTPTVAGTYQWVANYSGDANNNPVPNTALGSESEIVNPAVTTLTTTAGATVVLGSGDPLTDSATLSGGTAPKGTITFTLYAPNGTTVLATQTASVNGNGTYTTPAGYTPTAAGTYQWVASYSGDANNSAIPNTTEGNEPEIVSLASPTLVTTAGGTVVLGSGDKLTDSATLAGGYNPTAPSHLFSMPRMARWWTPKRTRSTAATTPTTLPPATRPPWPARTSGSPATAATRTTTPSPAPGEANRKR